MFSALLLSLFLAATPQTASVVAVHDGDTITVRMSGHTEKIRLVGIDSPELQDERQAYRDAGYAARNYARSRLGGETVTLEAEPRQGDRDAYGRLLRYVILDDGTNINEEMVRKGTRARVRQVQFHTEASVQGGGSRRKARSSACGRCRRVGGARSRRSADSRR